LYYDAEADPLCYAGTSVLRNLLDIRDQRELDEFELALFLTRADEPFPVGKFDYPHYLRLHHHLFQDVYSWAGQVRSIRIGKGGSWFCNPEYIDGEMRRIFRELGDPSHLVDTSSDSFAATTAHILAELNAVHPFREGNGRTQLAFLASLADYASLPFREEALEKDRVMSAMIDSFHGDETPLATLIADLVGDDSKP
jgi:cell filamentation protein